MSIPPRFRRLFRIDRGSEDVPTAVADELQFHFDMTIEELVAAGMSREEATREAHRRFGDVEQTRSHLHGLDRARVTLERRARWWSGLRQDLRYAVRGLRRSPGFTLGVTLTLALGIGANATMFSIIDPILFRPPAYLRHSDRVHRPFVATVQQGSEAFQGSFSYRQYLDLASDTRSFERFAGYWATSLAVGTGDNVEEQRITGVSASFWPLFSVRPVLGRFFGAEEDRLPFGEPVVVLSWPYWQIRLGGRTDVLGQQLRIGKLSYTIIGVAPRDFLGFELRRSIGFVPLTNLASNVFEDRGAGQRYSDTYNMNWLRLVAERKAGITAAVATADLQHAVVRSLERRALEQPGRRPISEIKPRAMLSPVQEQAGPNRSATTRVGTWLVGVALVVLLIACANVGNLLLARALRRRREIAVRLALGVTRGRLLAQLLTESLLLAALGAVAGLFVATWGASIVRGALAPDTEPIGILSDTRLLVVAGITMTFTAIVCGLAPALLVFRADLVAGLRGGVREGGGPRSRLRSGLLIAQGALSMLLLVGAALFVSSLRAVRAEPLGYDPAQITYVEQNLRGVPMPDDERYRLLDRLVTRAGALPGVVAATRTTSVPFWTDWSIDLFVPGIDSVGKLGDFILHSVSSGYFRTMGTAILEGRGLVDADRAGSEPVIVVSRSMAHVLWPNQPALGKCVKLQADSLPCHVVVGVAEDIKRGSLSADPGLQYYVPAAQYPAGAFGILVRTTRPAAPMAESIRRSLQAEMPGPAYLTAQPLDRLIAPQMVPWELGATMFTLFGGLALLVASVGLYSVLAYGVAQRRQELGVRIALGARVVTVLRLVVRDAMQLMLVAVALGLCAALAAARWVAPLLFHTSPRDPVILAGVAAILLLVSLAAAFAPAWRAAHVDPAIALRSE